MQINAYFEGLETSHYRIWIEMFEDRYNECITLEVMSKNKAIVLFKKLYFFQ